MGGPYNTKKNNKIAMNLRMAMEENSRAVEGKEVEMEYRDSKELMKAKAARTSKYC